MSYDWDMPRIKWPKKRMVCPWGGHEALAVPIVFGLLAPEYEKAIGEAERKGKVVHWGCFRPPWHWWCPQCEFPIPSEDDYWGEASEEHRDEMLGGLREAWEEEQQRRRNTGTLTTSR